MNEVVEANSPREAVDKARYKLTDVLAVSVQGVNVARALTQPGEPYRYLVTYELVPINEYCGNNTNKDDDRNPYLVVEQRRRQTLEECSNCDGCGWYEDGAAIKTTCDICNGTGLVPRSTTI